MLGLAFHPGYATNGRLFVYYIDNAADGRLVEYRAADADHADPAPVRTILTQAFPSWAFHYGGTVAFGPDGYLYLGLGDGQNAGLPTTPAEDGTSLLGKMLRLDVDRGDPYAVPADNPFVGRDGWRPEIWLLGLRNPYRWSFDRATGDLWIGDVGERAFEEVSFVPAGRAGGGRNLGWPRTEGRHCFRPETGCDTSGITLPIVEYYHDEGCSVTGGVVYRGAVMPAVRGTYFYGDYCGGWVRWLRMRNGAVEPGVAQLEAPVAGDNVVGFGEDAAGEVYVVMASGRIYRIAARS